MSYATQQQLIDRYGESALLMLADRAEPPAGTIDATIVGRALTDTDALIDGFLKGRYLLPLPTTPPLLCDLALQISIYKLHVNTASDKITADYSAAINMLKLIANGTVRLDVAGVEPAASGASGVRATDRCRDLTPDNLKGFV